MNLLNDCDDVDQVYHNVSNYDDGEEEQRELFFFFAKKYGSYEPYLLLFMSNYIFFNSLVHLLLLQQSLPHARQLHEDDVILI